MGAGTSRGPFFEVLAPASISSAVTGVTVKRWEDEERLAARGESLASHRDGRGAPPARRDDRAYREYVSEEQRRRRGCIARRMQPDFHHGRSSRDAETDGEDAGNLRSGEFFRARLGDPAASRFPAPASARKPAGFQQSRWGKGRPISCAVAEFLPVGWR